MNTPPTGALTVVSSRSDQSRTSPNNVRTWRRDAAYRRLTATILCLDVATLARHLRSQRISEQGTETRAA
jgi:hypothetical protein